MRVLAFCDVDWSEGSGGVERALSELYPRLVAAYGMQVHLVTLSRHASPRQTTVHGVQITRMRHIPLDWMTGMQMAIAPELWRTLPGLVREFRPDVIHAHTLFYHTTLVAAVTARRYHLPLVLTLHIGAVSAFSGPYRVATQIYERTVGTALLAIASRVICVSDDVGRHARALGVPTRKLTVVPNGVDAARFVPTPHRPTGILTLLCVGRLIFNKGQQYLLDAVATLRRAGITMHVVFAGEGPMRERLRRRAIRLGIGDAVTFHGWVDRIDFLLTQADIFVRPSLSEGMSLAMMEAMAAGLPVIASDVSGVRQLICDGVDGLIVPPKAVPALSAAIARCARDPELRRCLGMHARLRVLPYDWSRTATATAEVLAHAHQ